MLIEVNRYVITFDSCGGSSIPDMFGKVNVSNGVNLQGVSNILDATGFDDKLIAQNLLDKCEYYSGKVFFVRHVVLDEVI